MSIDYRIAKKLCTANELDLLEDLKPAELQQLTAPDLKRRIAQVRRISDKWQELAIEQGNSSDGSASSSQTKHEIFHQAVALFSARLTAVTEAEAKAEEEWKAVLAARVSAKRGPKPQPKPAQASRKKAAKKKAAKKKTAARAAAAPAAAQKAGQEKQAVVKAPPSDAAALKRANQGIQKGRVTDRQVAKSGLDSRVKGHVSASGRRNQAARSSRKRS